jgi:nucleotide-binding universal stress UspA family protein
MYSRILLAYDGSLEGRAALREGALMALKFQAQVFLLSVITPSAGIEVAESTYPGPVGRRHEHFQTVLDDGVARLKGLGLTVDAELVSGDPARYIGACARRIGADLVVVGHRRKTLLERWWSGPSGAYLSDLLSCSLLISRNAMREEAFQTALEQAMAARDRAKV